MSRLAIRDSTARPVARLVAPGAAAVGRKKGTGVRPWLMLDTAGQSQLLEAGKHSIMKRTGLPARDLRILDPLLSYPSTLLGRERAVVINLEHIKAIITAQEVLLLNPKDPNVSPFVDELQRRIVFHHRATSLEGGDQEQQKFARVHMDRQNNGDGSKILPFEFVALEACLESACSCLDQEAKTLEQEAHPALDKLTSKISTLNLERVRQIKSRLVALSGRVQKVRDELEHLLDDDDDMAEMYLTEKLVENSSNFSADDRDEVDEENLYIENTSPDAVPHEHVLSTRTRSESGKNVDVDELEMLLEAYFIQIDGIMNKLSTLREYVDDTEDYINIMLDDKQNHLLQMGVMLTTATLILSCFVVLAGIFGMNISIEWFDEDVNEGMSKFLWTVCSGTTGSVILYVSAIAWYKHKRLLE